MGNKLLAGVWRYLLGIPPVLWEKQIKKAKEKVRKSNRFMTADHRRVHHFVVRELPSAGGPLPVERVAQSLEIPIEVTEKLLQDLEEHLTFLYRNQLGEVTWAYPLTVEQTPHFITFDSGEKIYAA